MPSRSVESVARNCSPQSESLTFHVPAGQCPRFEFQSSSYPLCQRHSPSADDTMSPGHDPDRSCKQGAHKAEVSEGDTLTSQAADPVVSGQAASRRRRAGGCHVPHRSLALGGVPPVPPLGMSRVWDPGGLVLNGPHPELSHPGPLVGFVERGARGLCEDPGWDGCWLATCAGRG